MNHISKVKIQLVFVLLLAVAGLVLLSVITGSIKSSVVFAQEPQPTLPVNISQDALTSLGLSASDIQVASGPTDLEIVKTAQVSTVTTGGLVTFTISITNNGNNPISYTIFYDDYPVQMQNVAFAFNTDVISFTDVAKPEWLIYKPILVNETVLVTVTGILTSGPDITVTNTAVVTPIGPAGDTNMANNTSAAQVGIVGHTPLEAIFLPIIIRSPQPTIILAYHENFISEDAWIEFNQNGCRTDNASGQYWVKVDGNDRDCFPPARNENKPESPYRTYGEFEVVAYQDGDYKYNAAYGLFINGHGGDNYYLFRIWPNNGCSSGGSWELIRRKDGNSSVVKSGSCQVAIKRGYGSASTNILKIAHTGDRKLTVYVNNIQLDTFTDSSADHRTGTGVGVYARSDNNDIRVKFDDFKVYRYP